MVNLCVDIASNMVSMAKGISMIDARLEVIDAIDSKKALEKFNQFIKYQGGDIEKMIISPNTIEVTSPKSGVIKAINANVVANVSNELGSGKKTMEDVIDTTVGVFLNKQVGDKVEEGDTLCTLYYNKVKDSFNILDAYTIE